MPTGISELRKMVDSLIIVPNQRLLSIGGNDLSFIDAFRKADDILYHAVKGISDLIMVPGLINLDFADVKKIMAQMGIALMGTGAAEGENRAVEAAQRAISSPLLEDNTIQGARGILMNITGGPGMTLHEINEASSMIQQEAHEDANIIFGTVIDEKMGDTIRITVIATGFETGESRAKGNIAQFPGLRRGNNISIPTFIRDEKSADMFFDREEKTEADGSEDLEIPTFLRRQAD